MKQNRFKQRLAMLMMAGMTVSQLSMPTFAVEFDAIEENDVNFGYYGKQLLDKDDKATTTAAQMYANINKAWSKAGDDKALIYEVTMKVDKDLTEATNAQIQQYLKEKGFDISLIYNQAMQAIMYDYPEFYWISGEISASTWYETPASDTLKVSIEIGKQNSTVINNKIAIDQAVDKAITEINKTNPKTDYEKVVVINNYLVDHFVYNEPASNSDDDKYKDAHTLLGAFTDTSAFKAGNVVCEGYAKAFKAICDKMGIKSILVSGDGVTSKGSEKHMWNYVEMKGNWYLVDVTWNDPILPEGAENNNRTKYVLIGSNDDKEHIDNKGQLSSGGILVEPYIFAYPSLNPNKYEESKLSSDTTLKSLGYHIDGVGECIDLTQTTSTSETTKEYKVTLTSDISENTKVELAIGFFEDSKAKLDKLESGIIKDGKATATAVVKAEDGTTVTYIVNFEVAKSNDASLSSISYWVGGEKYDVKVQPGQKEIDIEVPYTTPENAQVDIKAVPTNSAAKAEYEPIVLEAGKGTGVVNVVAADGKTTATYKINITTQEDSRSKVNDITSFVLAGEEGKIENNEINVEVPYGTKLTDLTPIIKCSDKATVVVKGTDGVTADFSKPVTYVVTAENGTTKEYTVKVKVLSSIIVKQGLNNVRVYKGKDANFKIEFTPTISGDYTIVWNSATKKNVESHITLEAKTTTSSALVLEKVTSADQGEVSVKISRDADSSDFIESKANFKLKSSSSSSGTDSTTSSTNNNTSGGGGGGSATPAADKKVSEAWKDLSTAKQEEVKANFTNKMPYVLPANGLTEELVKELLGSEFSDAQVKEIVADPSKLKDLGISYTADTAVLTPVEEVSFKDINDSHWAYGNVEKLAKLGVVKGFEDNSFRPKEALAVADTFTFLNRVMLLNNDTYMNLSRETVEKYVTNKESWAFKDVATISSKLSEETLKEISALGDKPLSRGLLAQVLFEATQGKLAQSADSINFVDTQNSSYKEAIDYCVRAGLLKGVSANKMQPEKALTRAELMTVLVRLNDLMK